MAYYIKLRDKAFGPFNEEKLMQMIAAGKVTYETEVSTDKRYWQPLYQYPELTGSVSEYQQQQQYDMSSDPGAYDQTAYQPQDNYSQPNAKSFFSSGAGGGRNSGSPQTASSVSRQYNSQYSSGQNVKGAFIAFIALFFLVLVLFVIVIIQGAQIHKIYNNSSLSSSESIISRLASEATKSVVILETPSGKGSGIVIAHDDKSALILTNRHVVEEEVEEEVEVDDPDSDKDSKRTITRNKRVISSNLSVIIAKDVQIRDGIKKTATVVATPISEDIDLALVYVGDPDNQLSTQWKIASLQDVQQGENVYAIGHPVDYPFTITSGICSAKRNNTSHWEVQHTAPINPGNSGGPLLNSKGEIVGINTYIRVQPISVDLEKALLLRLFKNLNDPTVSIRETLVDSTINMILFVDYAHNLPRYNNLFFAMPADFIFDESEWTFLDTDKESATKKLLESIPNPKKNKEASK